MEDVAIVIFKSRVMESRVQVLPIKGNMRQIKAFAVQSGSLMHSKELIGWEIRGSGKILSINVGNIGYTSLRDVLATVTVNHKHGVSPHELDYSVNPRMPMKNHLVEKAARAYLQPTVIEKKSKSDFLTRVWQKLVQGGLFSSFFSDFLRGPLRSFTTWISRLRLVDLSQALQHAFTQLRVQTLRLLQA